MLWSSRLDWFEVGMGMFVVVLTELEFVLGAARFRVHHGGISFVSVISGISSAEDNEWDEE
jgi:hypothetical protein